MSEKVCPSCGNDRFYVIELLHRTIVVNGNGDFCEADGDLYRDVLCKTLTCTDCSKELTAEQLVTESHFHEVIALEEEEHVHQSV